MPVLGTVLSDFSMFPFQGLQILAKQTIGLLFYSLITFSSLRYSCNLSILTSPTGDVGLFQSVRNMACVATHTKRVEEY